MISFPYSNEAEVISSLDDIYDVGTFVQITELQDLGERIRMIIQGHRRYRHRNRGNVSETPPPLRIRITGPLEVQVEKTTEKKNKKKKGWRARIQKEPEPVEEEGSPPRVLMVRTENIAHDPFDQTQEIKAVSAEVIKTIRDIIALNPLYR